MKSKHLIIWTLLLVGCTGKSHYGSFRVPSVSESHEESIEKGLFVDFYDLQLISETDTINYEQYAWLEYVWHGPNGPHDSLVIDFHKTQLVFPTNEQIINCPDIYDNCDFEIYDSEWGTAGLSGDRYYYKPRKNKKPTNFDLNVYKSNRKTKSLKFTKTK